MWNPRWHCVASVLLAALAAEGRVASAETCALTLKRLNASPDAAELPAYRSTSSQSLFMQSRASAFRLFNSQPEFRQIVKKEPEKYILKDPLRGVAKLGSGRFAFVLDAKDEKSKGYDRLRFDLNGNGDLTDDRPIDSLPKESPGATLPASYSSHQFPRVDLKIPVDGQSSDYSFLFRVYSSASTTGFGYGWASLTPAAYRVGDITLEGKKHEVALVDNDANGRFNDETRIPGNISYSGGGIYAEMGDVLLIDADKAVSSAAAQDSDDDQARQYVSKLAKVGDGFYQLKISPTGDQLTLTPSTLPIGYVTNPNGPFQGMIYGDRGFLTIRGEAGKPVAVPEGQWRLLSYSIHISGWKPPGSAQKPAQPKGLLEALSKALNRSEERRGEPRYGPPGTCSVSARGTTKYKPVAVRKGETVPLPFGPPYKPLVEGRVSRWAAGAEASLSMSLVGSGGETVSNLVVDGYRPPKPELTITKAKGEVVQRGSFEYG